MAVTDVGMETEVSEVAAKAAGLILSTDVGMEMEEREMQEVKAPTAIPVTVVGIKTAVMVEQPEKALSGMKDTSLGMVMILWDPQEEQSLQGK